MYLATKQLSGCAGCQPAPLGLGLLPVPQTNWQTWALAALAALIIYQLFFSRSQRARRKEIAEARARYREEIRRIRAKYPRF